jgi:glycosyltransferase involved in cell wall biosynthesis
MFPAFFNPNWIAHIRRTAREANANLILCRELPLAPAAISIARSLGIPLVLDLGEDYPGMLMQLYNRRDFRLVNLLVRNPFLAGLIERWCVRRADGVLVVTESAAERVRRLGAGRIEIVGNTPTSERIAALGQLQKPTRCATDPLRLVYLGLLETARGIDMALEAMEILARRGANVKLDLIGADHGDRFAAVAEGLGVAEHVHFHGYVPQDEAIQRMAAADIGLMPHHISRHIRTTLPNKLFDYMAAGLPVIATDAAPVRHVLETERCGLVHPDGDAAALADCVMALEDPVLRCKMGQAGRQAVESRYNWPLDAHRLCTFIRDVSTR